MEEYVKQNLAELMRNLGQMWGKLSGNTDKRQKNDIS